MRDFVFVNRGGHRRVTPNNPLLTTNVCVYNDTLSLGTNFTTNIFNNISAYNKQTITNITIL